MTDIERLTSTQQQLGEQWDVATEKWNRLRKAYLFETRVEEKFRLEREIAEVEKTREQIEVQLAQVEHDLQEAAAPQASTAPPPDSPDTQSLDSYLYRLFRDASPVNLSGIQRGGGEETTTCLNLWEVYTALLTQRIEQHDGLLEKGLERSPDDARRESAVALLNKYDRLVLLGDAGSGKSTFVNFVVLCLTGELLQYDQANLEKLRTPLPNDDGQPTEQQQPWEQGTLTPIKIILRDFAATLPLPANLTPSQHLLAFLEQTLTEGRLAECAPALRQRIEQGQTILLFDGLDEVQDTERFREQTYEMIEDCAQRFRACRILVTSRTYAYQRRLAKFADAVLLPFGDGQIRWFVQCWYEHVSHIQRKSQREASELAHALQDEIFADARVRDMAQRPLLLTMIADLHEFRGSIPKNQVQLYSEAAELLLQRWERRKFGVDEQGMRQVKQPSLSEFLKLGPEGPTLLRTALAELAFQAHDQETLTNRQHETADIAEKELVARLLALRRDQSRLSDRLLISYLRDRAGILILRGAQYTFPHRSFQEYLTARYLYDSQEEARYPQNIVMLIRREPERWREVFFLAVQMANPDHAWRIVELLCPPEPDSPDAGTEDAWGAWFAAQVLESHIGLGNIKFQNDLLKKAKVQRWLKAILTASHAGQPLPALERAKAGDLLAAFGDDRPGVGCIPLPSTSSGQRLGGARGGLPDIAWVHVPAGEFWMGSDKRIDKNAEDREQPRHRVRVPEFRISRYPITNAQYRAFVEDGGYTTEQYWTKKGWKWRKKEGLTTPRPAGREFDLDNHPVVNISWYEAMAFCAWLTAKTHPVPSQEGKEETPLLGGDGGGFTIRLPTEAEWEYAARGPHPPTPSPDSGEGENRPILTPSPNLGEGWGGVYPWGDEITPEHANYSATNLGVTSAVGCFPTGRTWCGADDMIGNVWEWCLNAFYDYKQGEPSEQEVRVTLDEEKAKVARGGTWINHPRHCRCAFRNWGDPVFRSGYHGFRVVVAAAWTL